MHCGTLLSWNRLALTGAVVASVFAIVAGSGCTVVRPDARASAATIVAHGEATAAIDITLEIINAELTEVELINYDYKITLDDGRSYGGRWAALRALPPGQTVTATIPAIVPEASARVGARWVVSGTASYRDPQSFARILYEAGLLKTQAEFGGSGTLAAKAPAIPAPK